MSQDCLRGSEAPPIAPTAEATGQPIGGTGPVLGVGNSLPITQNLTPNTQNPIHIPGGIPALWRKYAHDIGANKDTAARSVKAVPIDPMSCDRWLRATA